jgi:hypothetical protein
LISESKAEEENLDYLLYRMNLMEEDINSIDFEKQQANIPIQGQIVLESTQDRQDQESVSAMKNAKRTDCSSHFLLKPKELFVENAHEHECEHEHKHASNASMIGSINSDLSSSANLLGKNQSSEQNLQKPIISAALPPSMASSIKSISTSKSTSAATSSASQEGPLSDEVMVIENIDDVVKFHRKMHSLGINVNGIPGFQPKKMNT